MFFFLFRSKYHVLIFSFVFILLFLFLNEFWDKNEWNENKKKTKKKVKTINKKNERARMQFLHEFCTMKNWAFLYAAEPKPRFHVLLSLAQACNPSQEATDPTSLGRGEDDLKIF